MKVTISREVDLERLNIYALPVSWANTLVNGVNDTPDGNNIPCKFGVTWCPVIEIDTGRIINWKKGTTASIHYKLPGALGYEVADEYEEIIVDTIVSSVPKTLSIGTNNYKNTIIMDIDENGVIANWNFKWEEFAD